MIMRYCIRVYIELTVTTTDLILMYLNLKFKLNHSLIPQGTLIIYSLVMIILVSSIILGIVILLLLLYVIFFEKPREESEENKARFTFNMKKENNYSKEVNNEFTIQNIVNIDNVQTDLKGNAVLNGKSPYVVNNFDNKVIVPNNTPVQIICNNYFFNSSDKST